MELFKVICVTCKSKLSVRNEALIGQIVGCPKCGSMVEVARPAAAVAALDAASTDSTVNISGNISARQVEELSEAVAETELAAQRQHAESAAASPDETIPAEAMPAEAMPAEVLHATESVVRYQLITWSIASFVIGASLVGAVLYKSTPSQTEDQHDQSLMVSDQIAKTTATSEPPKPEPIVSVVDAAQETSQPTKTEAVETLEPVEKVVVAPKFKQVQDTPEVAVEKVLPTPIAEQPAPSSVLTNDPAPRLARKFDALEVDLENLSLASATQPEPKTRATEIDFVEDTSAAAPQVPNVTVPGPRLATQLGPTDEIDALGRDAKRQLALMSPVMMADELTVIDALNLFADLSGQPVSVGPDQLLMAGITPRKKVALSIEEITLGDALQKLLKPLRMEYSTEGPQVIITRKDANRLREIQYPIEDLVSADQDEARFASWIQQLVAPSTWREVGGEGSLKVADGQLNITQPQHVQYQVLILLERMRLARKLTPKSRYPVQRLAGTPAALLIKDKLDRTTTFTFSQFTSLDEVFAYWQEKVEVPLLVDWPALASNDLWPESTIKAAIIDQPWHTALSKVLQPLGLDWRPATGGAIEITTAEKVQNQLQLEVYPTRSSVDIKKLLSLADGDSGVILYDPVGKVVLALQPASIHPLILEELN